VQAGDFWGDGGKTKIKRLRVSAHRRFVSNKIQRDFQASCFFDSPRLTPSIMMKASAMKNGPMIITVE
jgi:hypothetical protein